jgi:hypothetical protein
MVFAAHVGQMKESRQLNVKTEGLAGSAQQVILDFQPFPLGAVSQGVAVHGGARSKSVR